MAPETLSSQTYPASDVWAAGVMAYQLLSGYLPFDDARNPNAPALSGLPAWPRRVRPARAASVPQFAFGCSCQNGRFRLF